MQRFPSDCVFLSFFLFFVVVVVVETMALDPPSVRLLLVWVYGTGIPSVSPCLTGAPLRKPLSDLTLMVFSTARTGPILAAFYFSVPHSQFQ